LALPGRLRDHDLEGRRVGSVRPPDVSLDARATNDVDQEIADVSPLRIHSSFALLEKVADRTDESHAARNPGEHEAAFQVRERVGLRPAIGGNARGLRGLEYEGHSGHGIP